MSTDTPHDGCAKCIERFGPAAVLFVNGPEAKVRADALWNLDIMN